MKKNLISIIILALLIVNIVLTAIMMFSVAGASKKTAALVDNIATALSLELTAGGTAEEEEVVISMADTETFQIPSGEDGATMTIPLKKAEGDDKDRYCILSVTLSINTKDEAYKTYGSDLTKQEGVIKDKINEVFSRYTMDEARANQEAIKKEILSILQQMYESKFIYNVSFSDIMFG